LLADEERPEAFGEKQPGEKGVSLVAAAWLVAKVAIATVRRRLRGTDHDIFPTAVEELLRPAYLADLGKFAWDGMKEVGQAMWRDDGHQPGPDGPRRRLPPPGA
jgi:hypothetical protein